MTITQKRKLLQRIVDTEKELAQLKEIRLKLASAEYASASMSSGGGSKSYTRADIGKITEAIEALQNELQSNRALLNQTNAASPKQIMRIWF